MYILPTNFMSYLVPRLTSELELFTDKVARIKCTALSPPTDFVPISQLSNVVEISY